MIGGLSMTEVIIILGLALLLLGPDQLPTLAKSLGKGLKELRKATDDIKSQFESEIARIDIDPQKIMSPAPPPPNDAAATPALPNADDPAAARAAARRAAVIQEKLSLVPPVGTVVHPLASHLAKAAAAQETTAAAPQAPPAAAQEARPAAAQEAPPAAAPEAPPAAPAEEHKA
jgi:sec-independent protein translocase protein TatB